LARIIERARVLQDQARAAPIARGRAVRRELVVPLFVAAMGWLMAAVVLFLIEMQLAAEQLRRRF
jgi:hypothetical protein